jgi:hypothetical protein
MSDSIVGLKLDLIRGVSWWLVAAFIDGVVKILSLLNAGCMAGFRGLERAGSDQS